MPRGGYRHGKRTKTANSPEAIAEQANLPPPPVEVKETQITPIVELPKEPSHKAQELLGIWGNRVVDHNHVLYASKDAQAQFKTIRGRTSGKHVKINLNGVPTIIHDIWPSTPQEIHSVWISLPMSKEWLARKS
jgi:hypothetical protein